MASVFWDAKGILLIDYFPRGQTIIGDYYTNLIRRLRETIKQKRRGKLSGKVLFHQDNAAVHKSTVAMAAIHDAGFELIEHPPYSPDLAPSDFYLFPNLEDQLRGKRFDSDNDVMCAVEEYFDSLDESIF